MTDADQRQRESVLEYRCFLDNEATDRKYKSKVEHMIKLGETRLIVEINDIRNNPNLEERARGLIQNPEEELVAFRHALKEYVTSLDPAYGRSKYEFQIGLRGSFGSRHVTPRTLTSRFLNQTVCVEGIVSGKSSVEQKTLKLVFHSPSTNKSTERGHFDLLSLEYVPRSSILDTIDEEGNPVKIDPDRSRSKSRMTITIQEMPEVADSGQLPHSVDVILEDDLVKDCEVGDRVHIVGTYRRKTIKQDNFCSCVFRLVVVGNYVEQGPKPMTLTEDDMKACEKWSKTKEFNLFERLASSLAPSIHGHESVKKALLCLLLGGVEETPKYGRKIRGDIDLLLIGSRSVVKSQLLRFVRTCTPGAILTTGRSSLGVGLTAAIITDPETGDPRLEAGSMVLADRNVVCVDEFNNLPLIDRKPFRDVMESGLITITHPRFKMSLRARCSVLAAANAVTEKYDINKLPKDNLGMPASLLSRFDLVYRIPDDPDIINDIKVPDDVLRTHRHRPLDELDGEPTNTTANTSLQSTHQVEGNQGSGAEMFEIYNPLLDGRRNVRHRYFTIEFMRKYILHAKSKKPEITEDIRLLIKGHHSKLKEADKHVPAMKKTQPIAARTLETLIRLSTAIAKARLSDEVKAEDAAEAMRLVQLACFDEVRIEPEVRQPEQREDMSYSRQPEREDDTTTDKNVTSRKRRRVLSISDSDGDSTELDYLQQADENNVQAKMPAL